LKLWQLWSYVCNKFPKSGIICSCHNFVNYNNFCYIYTLVTYPCIRTGRAFRAFGFVRVFGLGGALWKKCVKY
jgi:hypothetical protein